MSRNFGVPNKTETFPRTPLIRDFADIASWLGVRVLHVAKWVFLLAMIVVAAGLLGGCSLPDSYYENFHPGFSQMEPYEKARIRESNRANRNAWVSSWGNSNQGFRGAQFQHGLGGGRAFGSF